MMKSRTVAGLLGLAAVAVALFGGNAVYAQRGRDGDGGRGQDGGRGRGRNRIPPDSALLAAITSLKCSFPASASATWDAGQPKTQTTNTAGIFTLNITEIDVQEGTARAVGLGAPAEVTVKLAGANLHILDMRPNGALAITTVFAEESHDGRLKAVHSRSEYVNGPAPGAAAPPSVSQYYGDCEAGPR